MTMPNYERLIKACMGAINGTDAFIANWKRYEFIAADTHARLVELVKKFSEGYFQQDDDGIWVCVHCQETSNTPMLTEDGSRFFDEIKHDANCPITIARTLLTEIEKEAGK